MFHQEKGEEKKIRKMEEFSYRELEAATRGFALERLIGKGSHGCVYGGILKGGKHVAVKKVSQGLQLHQDNSKLDNEIDVLASLHSPHLVNLLGVSHGSTDKLLVMEYMPNGSLHDRLHSSPAPLSWPRRTTMALEIAQALQSLHEATPPVVHRDVKPANVLLDRRRRARLADFSLAIKADGSKRSDPAGTMGYLDPCYTAPEKLSPMNDVFSFGVVLLELVSSRRAVDVEHEPASIVAWAVPMIESGQFAQVCDRRVALPGHMEGPVGRVLSIAARCVCLDAEKRPSIAEVMVELQEVTRQVRFSTWSFANNKIGLRMYRCLRAWRRWTKNRVTTTKIVCKDHIVGGGDDDQR